MNPVRVTFFLTIKRIKINTSGLFIKVLAVADKSEINLDSQRNGNRIPIANGTESENLISEIIKGDRPSILNKQNFI